MFLRGNTSPEKLAANIQNDFGWNRHMSVGGQAVILYPDTAIEPLADAGLDWMVEEPGSLDRLNALPAERLGNGGFGSVYEIGETGIVVKKHFPNVYQGGRQDTMREVPGKAILRQLMVNLAIERALADDPDYVTPKYLGHMMLEGADVRRHYTLMTKLERVETETEQAQKREQELRDIFTGRCVNALRLIGHKRIPDFDSSRANLFPTRDEDGRLQLGVIDMQKYKKGQCPKARHPVTSRYRKSYDPDAPWLSTQPIQAQSQAPAA
jgi:hypothetical protein